MGVRGSFRRPLRPRSGSPFIFVGLSLAALLKKRKDYMSASFLGACRSIGQDSINLK
jgi:hypothetical protein